MRLVRNLPRRLRVLRPFDHPGFVIVRINELHVDAGLTACKHAKDFIGERLANFPDILEIEHNGSKSIAV